MVDGALDVAEAGLEVDPAASKSPPPSKQSRRVKTGIVSFMDIECTAMSRILHRSLSVGVVTAMLSIISISTTAAEPFPCSYSAVRDAGWTEAVLKVHEPQLLIEFAERVAGWQVSATPVQLDASGTRSTARQ